MLDVSELCFIMEEGATEPINCILSDGTNAVVKYPNNTCGTTTLINEWIGNNIAQEIGVTVPSFGLCILESSIIYSKPEIDILEECNTGICFYSQYMSKAAPLKSKRHVKNYETEKVVLLDHILNNFDRHEGNLFYDVNTGIVYAIDYSHLFSKSRLRPDYDSEYVIKGMNPNEYLYTDILKANSKEYDILCYSAGFDEATLNNEVKRIKETITHQYLESLFDTLPDDWLKTVGREKTYQLIDFIDFRVSNLEKIEKMITEERQR